MTLGRDVGCSRNYRTSAFPKGSGPDYINGVFDINTNMESAALLAALNTIEAEFGRVRKTRWGPRTLDLDILCREDEVAPDQATWQHWHDLPLEQQMEETPQKLILPHPRLQDRAFVLVPMADVWPEWVHPLLGLTVREMLDRLPQSELADVVAT